MSLVVNTNIGSLNTQRSLAASGDELKTAMERLSSGKKINSAADDAAGFAIAERMTAQIRGINMAIKNANNGLSLIATIENAAAEVSKIWQRIKELSIQASNGTNSHADKQYLQKETEALVEEIGRIANQTQFNGERVLHYTNFNRQKSIQVGTEANQTIDFDTKDIGVLAGFGQIQGYNLWSDSSSALGPSTAPQTHTSDTDFNIVSNGTSYTIDIANGDSAADMVSKINAVAPESGVFARAVTYMELRTPDGSDQAVSLKINGVSTGSFVLGANGDPAEDAVNLIAEKSGVAAYSIDGGVVLWTHGRDIQLELESNDPIKINPPWGATGTELSASGGNDSVTVTGSIKLMSGAAFTVDRVGSTAPVFFDLDSRAQEGMWTSNLSSNSTLTSFYHADYGRNGYLTDVNLTYNSDLAMAVATAGINQINDTRAYYGALQNRLEYTISNLTGVGSITQAARSRIEDADFAVESARLAKVQVLQETGTAMLAQANSSSQLVLSLIR